MGGHVCSAGKGTTFPEFPQEVTFKTRRFRWYHPKLHEMSEHLVLSALLLKPGQPQFLHLLPGTMYQLQILGAFISLPLIRRC